MERVFLTLQHICLIVSQHNIIKINSTTETTLLRQNFQAWSSTRFKPAIDNIEPVLNIMGLRMRYIGEFVAWHTMQHDQHVIGNREHYLNIVLKYYTGIAKENLVDNKIQRCLVSYWLPEFLFNKTSLLKVCHSAEREIFENKKKNFTHSKFKFFFQFNFLKGTKDAWNPYWDLFCFEWLNANAELFSFRSSLLAEKSWTLTLQIEQTSTNNFWAQSI